MADYSFSLGTVRVGDLLMDELWEALKLSGQDKYFQRPYIAFPEPIYGISTRPGFIFDDIFWDVFHSFSFHICHVTALVNENGSNRVFDLRFKRADASA